jgi:hypothetical protein
MLDQETRIQNPGSENEGAADTAAATAEIPPETAATAPFVWIQARDEYPD